MFTGKFLHNIELKGVPSWHHLTLLSALSRDISLRSDLYQVPCFCKRIAAEWFSLILNQMAHHSSFMVITYSRPKMKNPVYHAHIFTLICSDSDWVIRIERYQCLLAEETYSVPVRWCGGTADSIPWCTELATAGTSIYQSFPVSSIKINDTIWSLSTTNVDGMVSWTVLRIPVRWSGVITHKACDFASSNVADGLLYSSIFLAMNTMLHCCSVEISWKVLLCPHR